MIIVLAYSGFSGEAGTFFSCESGVDGTVNRNIKGWEEYKISGERLRILLGYSKIKMSNSSAIRDGAG